MTLSLMPYPRIRFFTANGTAPLVGGKIYTYQPGSTTPKTTYQDFLSVTPNAWPVVLDGNGEAIIYLDGLYDVQIFDMNGVQQTGGGTNIAGAGSTFSQTASSEWVSPGDVPTYISPTSFSVPGDKIGTYTVGTKIKSTCTSGTVYSTIASCVYSSVSTITVVNQVGVLDAGLDAANKLFIALQKAESPSDPIPPVVIKTGDYTITKGDVNTILVANKASSIIFILPSATVFPSGSWIEIKNIGAGNLTITGTIDGAANPVLTQYSGKVLWTDGTNYYMSGGYGSVNADNLLGDGAYREAKTENVADSIVRRDASGNFAAGTITANLTGNADTATNATNATNSTNATNATNASGTGTALYATETGLTTIRGAVASNGTITYGSGFTVNKGAAGLYTLVWTSNFSAPPSTIPTAKGSGSVNYVANVYSDATSSSIINIVNLTGTYIDVAFSFISIGPK